MQVLQRAQKLSRIEPTPVLIKFTLSLEVVTEQLPAVHYSI